MREPGSDITETSTASAPPQRLTRKYTLVVKQGRDAGFAFTVDAVAGPSRVFIGQSPICEVRLTDRLVSRRHAALEAGPRGLRFTDLASTNGSRVNGLTAFDVLLVGGETIQVGSTVLEVAAGEKIVAELAPEDRFGKTVGASTAMRRLYPLCAALAASCIPVVIEGETGTGKEVLAESIHEAGPRAAMPFVVFDCTTVSPTLVEAALFGHERGAFTGAVSNRRGLFEEADRGTLLIDEIGDLDLPLQAKLLRVLERSEFRRIGGTKWLRADVRIIAATRRDLDHEVQAGRFRDDLFFRLSVARVELPPLRCRKGDVSLLAVLFWNELGGAASALTGDFLARLEDSLWPGNVRELRNVIAKRIALGELVEASALSRTPPRTETASDPDETGSEEDPFDPASVLDLPFPIARQRVLDDFERRYVKRVLDRNGGNVGQAASSAGIGRRYFQTIRARRRDPA